MTKDFYLMARKIAPDGALIRRKSHRFVRFKTGQPLGADFEAGPVVFKLDAELRNGPLPTFFSGPALVSTVGFYEDLKQSGVDCIEARPAVLEDPVDGRSIQGYVLLNIVGLVSCADMPASEAETLGEDMTIINRLVLNSKRLPEFDLFHVAEDTDNIVVSERVYRHLKAKNYPDVYFEKLEQV